MRPGLALLLLGAVGVAPRAGAAQCGQGEFRCGDGGCIAGAWVCDGRAECGDGSDETPDACRSVSCSPGEFSCGGRRRRCVPASWRCDGHRDCDNGSDELDCPPRTCGEEQLRCGDGACVSRAFACDGERDCEDGADEAACPPPAAACGPHAFACAGGGCVPRLWACDGDPDCGDGSDEGPAACGTSPPRPPPACPPLQFACGSGECVHRRWRCDRSPDCRDGSDEEGCAPPATCRPDQFQCGDGRCVLGVRQCDGEADCADGSDEEGCHNVTACDGRHQFQCRSGECIPAERVCDSKRDCRDWSDEPLKECGVNECLEGGGGCAHLCQDLPLGFRCLCPPGFALRPDGRTCEDIDECRDPQSCSQRCLNLPGGFECRCHEGYEAAPQNGCRALGPPAALLFSNRHEVRRLALGGGGEGRVLGPLKHAGALDVDVAAGALLWADRARGAIRRSPLPGALNGSRDAAVTDGSHDAAVTGAPANGSQEAAATGAPGAVAVAEAWADGLALDWIHQLLYWADARRGALWAGDAGGTRRTALLREEGAQPRAIALDPLNGYMYWTDWGASPKIGKGGMNGADQFALVTQGLEWPSGIALDLPSQRLYWVDARLHALSSVGTDGGGRRTLLADPQLLAHPFAVAVFEDSVFWSDVAGRAVLSASRRTGARARRVAPGLAFPGDLVVLHPLRQPPGPRRCPPAGGGCAFLCLPAPRLGPRGPRYTCACAPGQRLAPDGRRCADPLDPSQPPTPGPAPHSRGATPGPASASSNGTAGGDAVGQGGPRPGLTALAVVLPLVLLLLAGAGARGLWRSWGGRSTHSISFSNPLFQKPGGEGGPFGGAMHQALTLDEDGVA